MWQGTHVAGLAAGAYYGVAKDAELVSVAVAPGCRRPGSGRALAEGLAWIAADLAARPSGAVVVVVAVKISVRQRDAVVVDMVEDLANGLVDAGVVVVAAAGASRVDACAFTPGRLERVVTVAGAEVVRLPTRLASRPWIETNAGRCVDVWAQATRLESAFAPEPDATGVYSGAPQAAGIAAGVVATLMERHPDEPRDVLVERLMNASSTSIMMYTRPETVANMLQNPVG